MRRTVLAVLMTVGFLVSSAAADSMTVYAPGSAVPSPIPAPPSVSAAPGSTVNVPIYLGGTGSDVGISFELTYDPTVLKLASDADVTLGSLTSFPGTTILTNTIADGDWYLELYGTHVFTVPPDGGTVFNVLFHVKPGAAIGSTPIGFPDDDYDNFTFANGSINIVVPEPGTLVLLVTAGLGLLAYVWRRRGN